MWKIAARIFWRMTRLRRIQQAFVLCGGLILLVCLSLRSPVSLNQLTPFTEIGNWRGNHSNRHLPTVLCLVLTMPKNKDKVIAVNQTWGKRCNKLLFVYGAGKKTHLTRDRLNVNIPEDRKSLPLKIRAALVHVYSVYNTSYDWVLKADDDTYVIMENLKTLLAGYDPGESNYLGAHFKKHVTNGYMSGGAGYVFSSRALRDLVEVAFKRRLCNITKGDEDVQIGKCLQSVNAIFRNTSDVEGKETFHAEALLSYLSPPHPNWLNDWMKNKAKFGIGCCGKFSVTFHYVKPREMYVYEHLLYRISVHGNESRVSEYS